MSIQVSNESPITDVIALISGGNYHFTFTTQSTLPVLDALKNVFLQGQYRMAGPLGTGPTVRDDLAVTYPPDFDGELHIQVDKGVDSYTFSFNAYATEGQQVGDCFYQRGQEILTEPIEVRM